MRIPTGVDYQTFNFNFFERVLQHEDEITWFNRKGIKLLPNNKVAEVELTTNVVHGNYAGYQVTIIHKENGKITEHSFWFDDYMSTKNPNIDDSSCQQSGVADWYMETPELIEVDNLASQILHFIELYK